MVIYQSQSSVIHSVPLCLILPKKENTFMPDLSGKHLNMPILEGNKDVIWSKQTPFTDKFQRTSQRKENGKRLTFY